MAQWCFGNGGPQIPRECGNGERNQNGVSENSNCAKGLFFVFKSFTKHFEICWNVSVFYTRVVEMCKTFQTSVREMSQSYFSTLRRYNYVTPTSYLELILTFKTLLTIKRNEVNTAKNRYVIGLQKLEFASSQVMDPAKPFKYESMTLTSVGLLSIPVC